MRGVEQCAVIIAVGNSADPIGATGDRRCRAAQPPTSSPSRGGPVGISQSTPDIRTSNVRTSICLAVCLAYKNPPPCPDLPSPPHPAPEMSRVSFLSAFVLGVVFEGILYGTHLARVFLPGVCLLTPNGWAGIFVPLVFTAAYVQWQKRLRRDGINKVMVFATVFYGLAVTIVCSIPCDFPPSFTY